MKKYLQFITVCALLCAPVTALMGQASVTTINPGIKIGFTPGSFRNFTIGFELSYTHSILFGVVFDIDVNPSKKIVKTHIGVEGSGGIAGLSIGPTLVTENGQTDLGIGTTVYTGLIIHPYYSYTWRFKKEDIDEIGCYFKVPIKLSGKVDIL